jgi:hypothetical protein
VYPAVLDRLNIAANLAGDGSAVKPWGEPD